MRYFVETVTTYNATGKSRKGAILQKVAQRFEHVIIGDHNALLALIKVFERLVAACNKVYRGKILKVSYNRYSYYLCVESVDRSFNESVVFSMQLAPVGLTLFASNIHQSAHDDLVSHNDRKLLDAYYAKQIDEALSKGGDE